MAKKAAKKATKNKGRKRRPMSAAEKKAFVARMAKYRRNPPAPTNGRALPATVRAAPAQNKPRARRNPPSTAALKSTLRTGTAAALGGLAAAAGVAVFNRFVDDPAIQKAAAVLVPGLVAIAATQLRNADGKAAAAGAIGVAGLGVAKVISGAIVAGRNPPEGDEGPFLITAPARGPGSGALPMPIGWRIAS